MKKRKKLTKPPKVMEPWVAGLILLGGIFAVLVGCSLR
jgi:hypothetical protein